MFQRKAYNAVVGTLSMNSKVGPVAASATVDPAHRVYFDAALKVLYHSYKENYSIYGGLIKKQGGSHKHHVGKRGARCVSETILPVIFYYRDHI